MASRWLRTFCGVIHSMPAQRGQLLHPALRMTVVALLASPGRGAQAEALAAIKAASSTLPLTSLYFLPAVIYTLQQSYQGMYLLIQKGQLNTFTWDASPARGLEIHP